MEAAHLIQVGCGLHTILDQILLISAKVSNMHAIIYYVNQIREQTKVLRIYFNNHYGGKAVVNAMQFKEMIGVSLSASDPFYLALV